MSSSAGWYPDPGGQPGMYRYWTGTSWTEAITGDPQRTPPPPSAGYGPASGGFGASTGGTGTSTGPSTPGGGYPYAPTRRRGNLGWWLGGLAALVAVAIVVLLIVRGIGGGTGPIIPIGPQPTTSVTPNICPPAASDSPTDAAQPDTPGYITGGKLAYPELGAPWETGFDNRVPWGSLAEMQEVVDQADYDGQGHSWVASILVSDLFVGDGFASTKVAAETVLKCVLGTYYADTVVKDSTVSSARHDVDGHSGWLIETQLSFDIPQVNAKGERVLLLVVQTSDADYGLFYASVPDTRKELLPDARTAMSGLQVRG